MRVLYKLQDTLRKTLRDFNVVRLGDGEVESHLVGMGIRTGCVKSSPAANKFYNF